MSPPGGPRDPVSALGRRRRLARLALWWEAVWPRAWPVLAVVGVFLILALLDLPRQLPGILHILLLLGFAAVGASIRSRRRAAVAL